MRRKIVLTDPNFASCFLEKFAWIDQSIFEKKKRKRIHDLLIFRLKKKISSSN